MADSFRSAVAEKLRSAPFPAKVLSLLGDSLYRNSLYILLSSVTASAIGLAFWVVAANLYSIDDIGIAATLISASSLMASIASLGLDQGMIRYFPTHDKSMIFGTVVKVTTLGSVAVGSVFILGSSIWAPELVASGSYLVVFTGLVCCISMATMVHTAFVGHRMAKQGWLQNIFLGVRLSLLALFIGLGSMGILAALILSYIIVLPVSMMGLNRSGVKLGQVSRSYLKESLWFSTGNYIGFILSNLPYLSLPIIVFALLGSTEAAVYYMALSISSIIFLIPSAMATSLFVEGSHGESLGRIIRKSAMAIYGVLVPLILVFIVFEKGILGILGHNYVAEGAGILQLMVISSLFVASFMLESTILKIKGKIKEVIVLGAGISLSFFALSYLLVAAQGTEGIGLAWIGSYAVASLLGLPLMLGLKKAR